MSVRLIVNADDFGLTRGINRAIGELYRAGVLRSTTLMAGGPAFADAVAIARAHPGLGVGCHIVLTDGVPVLAAETLPTLCPNGSGFRPSLADFVRAVLLGRVDQCEIEQEARAQVEKIQQAGIRVTHVDTHKHTHVFPVVARALKQVLTGLPVQAIRNPFEPRHTMTRAGLRRQLEIAALNLFQQSFQRIIPREWTTEGTFGISATGRLTAETLRAMLAGLPDEGTFEMLCHPGYNDVELDRVTTRLRVHREVEREALLQEMPAMFAHPMAARLISYSELQAQASTS